MPRRHFFVPFEGRTLFGQLCLRAKLDLQIRRSDGAFVAARETVFDTASDFTTLPIEWAQEAGIEHAAESQRSVSMRGTTGSGVGYLGKATVLFSQVPTWHFVLACVFSRTAPRPLLSLADVVRNFHVSTSPQSKEHPHGAFLLRLRADHEGESRR